MMPKSAIVLAAGLGTRMRPYNGHVPKPLVTVGGRSLIDYGLDRLAEAGVERAIVNVRRLPTPWNGIWRRGSAPGSSFPTNTKTLAPAAASPRRCRSSALHRSSWSIPTRCGWTALSPTSNAWQKISTPTQWMRFYCWLRASAASAIDAAIPACSRTAGCAGAANTKWRRSSMPARQSFRQRCSRPPPRCVRAHPFVRSRGRRRAIFGLRLDGVWMHVGTPEAVSAAEVALAATA